MSRLTILNSMAGADFPAALDRHVAWGLTDLDLKDHIFGKAVAGLTRDEAARAARFIADRGLTTHCLSTGFFFAEVERGESEAAAALDHQAVDASSPPEAAHSGEVA